MLNQLSFFQSFCHLEQCKYCPFVADCKRRIDFPGTYKVNSTAYVSPRLFQPLAITTNLIDQEYPTPSSIILSRLDSLLVTIQDETDQRDNHRPGGDNNKISDTIDTDSNSSYNDRHRSLVA
jgi:hypothetical protein